MKMKYLIAGAAAALMVSTCAAKAADIVHYQEPVAAAPAFSWAGLYGGGLIGGGWADSKTTVKQNKQKIGSKSVDPAGFMGGFYGGYNYQFSDAILLGLDTDFIFSDLGGEGKIKNGFGRAHTRELWNGSTRGRIGYAWNRFLPYFAAGVSYANIKNGYTDENGNKAGKTDTRAGWNVGVGLDYAMTDHIILRGEYRFTDFGDDTYKAPADGRKYKVDFNHNDIRLGVAYKF